MYWFIITYFLVQFWTKPQNLSRDFEKYHGGNSNLSCLLRMSDVINISIMFKQKLVGLWMNHLDGKQVDVDVNNDVFPSRRLCGLCFARSPQPKISNDRVKVKSLINTNCLFPHSFACLVHVVQDSCITSCWHWQNTSGLFCSK